MTKRIYIQIEEMLELVRKAIGYMQDLGEEEYRQISCDLKEDLKYTIEAINIELLDSPEVCFCRLDDPEMREDESEARDRVVVQYVCWLDKITQVLKTQYHAKNIWEEKFVRLMDRVQYVDSDRIIEDVKTSLLRQEKADVDCLCAYYQRFHYMWGTLDVANDRYDVIINRVTALKEHREDFIWLYNQLGDWRSRLVLVNMLYNWVTFDLDYIIRMKEANFTDYFDLDLVRCDEDEVLVDLGAWTGDSALNYIQTYGRYKKIYCYEIDGSSMETMKKNLAGYSDIEFRNKGVGNENSIGYIEGSLDSSCRKLTDYDTGETIELVKLDDDINEKITLIKMDIEGAEQDALLGAARHIREEKPKLLISVYHNNEDIWKIPRMITDMAADYQFYLRSNGGQWGPAEILLLAVERNHIDR